VKALKYNVYSTIYLVVFIKLFDIIGAEVKFLEDSSNDPETNMFSGMIDHFDPVCCFIFMHPHFNLILLFAVISCENLLYAERAPSWGYYFEADTLPGRHSAAL
jgi:hypothetical protein